MEDAKLLSALPVPNAELHQPQDAAVKPRFGRTAEDSDRANRNGCDDDGDGWVRVTTYSALLFSPLLNGPLNREDELFLFSARGVPLTPSCFAMHRPAVCAMPHLALMAFPLALLEEMASRNCSWLPLQ